LSQRFGRTVLLKLELLSPIRSFKHRGALVAVDRIRREAPGATVVTASTGNHGQGVAYAARRAGLAVDVYAPESAAAVKIAAMRALGAAVVVTGADLDIAQQRAQVMADGRDRVYLEDGESPELMAGAATVTSEVLATAPDVETVVVPVGGGNLVGGALLARAAIGHPARIVGVQSTAASSATQSWLAGAMVAAPCSTFAGGLATTRPGALALDVMTRHLTDMVLVADADLDQSTADLLIAHGILVEGAAAATHAALARHEDELGRGPIALVLTGNWTTPAEARRAMALAEEAAVP
jgi:threonine dehydratase